MNSQLLPSLSCKVQIQSQQTSGTIRNETMKSACLSLCRNSSHEMIIKCNSVDSAKTFEIPVTPTIHTRFIQEGKATVSFKSQQSCHLIISNCPPDNLKLFLKGLRIKRKRKRAYESFDAIIANGKKLCQLNEISPLLVSEVAGWTKKSNLQNGLSLTPKNTSDRSHGTGTPRRGGRALVNNHHFNIDSPSHASKIGIIQLTSEQEFVLNTVKSGGNVFFTGPAGTGKSFLLHRIIGSLPPTLTAVTASTGIAASHINGVTLHSFAGISSDRFDDDFYKRLTSLLERPQGQTRFKQWKRIKHLIIDEVSMVSAQFFTCLDFLGRTVRGNDLPFGGIQVILTGDFFQLPPVEKGGLKPRYAFESSAWRSCKLRVLELTQVKRQSDALFVKLLSFIRQGRCSAKTKLILQRTASNKLAKGGIEATVLCTHNASVDVVNSQKLASLPAPEVTFDSSDKVGDSQIDRASQLAVLDRQCLAPATVRLKIGAQVMLTKNLNPAAGLVNGSRGVVMKFEASSKHRFASDTIRYPLVAFANGTTILLEPVDFIVRDPTQKDGAVNLLVRRQVPLRLAWAVSVHKSQGMSLDAVEMSLGNVFSHGQAYVALSRARSLDSLRCLDFDSSCVSADPAVVQFYEGIKSDCV